jgi:hypothetical protein
LYAFPVSLDTNGKFYVLVKDNGTGQPSEPLYSLIQHRPWRTGAGFTSFSSSAVEIKAGGVSLRKNIPNVAIYFDRWGRPKHGLGNVRQYYDESNQAWMAEKLVKEQTNGYFTKGNGLTGWFWGKTLGYTKRACLRHASSSKIIDQGTPNFSSLKFGYSPTLKLRRTGAFF